jgi:hypothetical protein
MDEFMATSCRIASPELGLPYLHQHTNLLFTWNPLFYLADFGNGAPLVASGTKREQESAANDCRGELERTTEVAHAGGAPHQRNILPGACKASKGNQSPIMSM